MAQPAMIMENPRAAMATKYLKMLLLYPIELSSRLPSAPR
jgi:hypothetical protein